MLAEIVLNTLHTLMELERQTERCRRVGEAVDRIGDLDQRVAVEGALVAREPRGRAAAEVGLEARVVHEPRRERDVRRNPCFAVAKVRRRSWGRQLES